MATKSQTLTSAEKKDLATLGWVKGSPLTIPENVSPVLKAKIQAEYAAENDLVASQDLPTATERQNAAVRERAAADGDKDMQKVSGVQEGAKTAERQNKASSK